MVLVLACHADCQQDSSCSNYVINWKCKHHFLCAGGVSFPRKDQHMGARALVKLSGITAVCVVVGKNRNSQ